MLPALLVLAVLWPIAQPVSGVGDTFQFWYAGHLVVTGASPYDQSAWHAAGSRYGAIAGNVATNCADPNSSACLWVYPPLTALFFAPFGLLEPPLGPLVINALVLVAAFVGVLTVVLEFGPRRNAARALLLTAAIASHAFVVDVAAGHFVGLLLIGVVFVARGLRTRQAWPVALGALTLALKPHLFLVLALLVLIVLARRRDWRTVALVAATLTAVTVAGSLRYPEAIAAIVERSGLKAGIAWSTTWALVGSVAPPAPLVALAALLAVAAVSAVASYLWAPPAFRDDVLVATAAALSLIATPYAQPYDLLLILPAFAAAVAVPIRGGPRSAILAIAAVAYGFGGWLPILFGQPHSVIGGIPGALPVLGLVLLAIALGRRDPSAAPADRPHQTERTDAASAAGAIDDFKITRVGGVERPGG